jgi:hypothetical protein
MGTYVGKWDCPLCGTKRIPGWQDGRTVEVCPACGGPSTGKWYLDDRSMEIADASEIQKAKAKRAWKCGHCGKVNDGNDPDCDACGNPRDIESEDKQFIAREYDPRDVPQSNEEIEEASTESPTDNPAQTEQGFSSRTRERLTAEAAARKKRRRKVFTILGIVGGAIALLVFLLTWKKEIPVTVIGFSWERSVDIEAYGPHEESSWSIPPTGAYGISSRQEIHHYDTRVVGQDCHTETHSVVCGTIDNGNGTFSDRYCDETEEVCVDRTVQDPVYATKYYYTIDRWGFDHTEKAAAADHNPHWPVFSGVATQPHKYREGKKKETYSVKLMRKSGDTDVSTVPQERWNALKPGQQLTGYKNAVFGYWMGLKE